jgi:hypothetical protein
MLFGSVDQSANTRCAAYERTTPAIPIKKGKFFIIATGVGLMEWGGVQWLNGN